MPRHRRVEWTMILWCGTTTCLSVCLSDPGLNGVIQCLRLTDPVQRPVRGFTMDKTKHTIRYDFVYLLVLQTQNDSEYKV